MTAEVDAGRFKAGAIESRVCGRRPTNPHRGL